MEVDGKLNETDIASCEPCSFEDKDVTADGYCNICEEFLCNSCFQLHLRHKTCRNHILGPLSQGRDHRHQVCQREVMCKTHKNEHVKYFCRKHDVVGCGECIVSVHNTCGVEFIRDVAINFQESTQFKDCLHQVSRIVQECNQTEKTLLDNTANNISSLEKVTADIKNFKKKLDDFLDHIVEDLLKKANKTSTDMKETISKLQTEINAISLDVSDIKSSLDACQFDDDALFINLIESKSKINDLEQAVSELNNTNTEIPLIFEANQNLKDLMSSNIIFGILGYTTQTNAEDWGEVFHPENKTRSATTQTEAEVSEASMNAASQTDPVITEATANQTDPVFTEATANQTDLAITKAYIWSDPRASGFDVGKKVKYVGNWYLGDRFIFIYDADGKFARLRRDDNGTITKVEEKGVVHVYWNNTCETYRHNAGQNGKFDVKLI